MQPIEPGELLDGKYRVSRRLGKGGMGVVFEAVHERIGRRVAIKLLRAGNDVDNERLARFEREAVTCGSLRHENIAAVLDFATDQRDRPYLVMELIDGMSLRDILRTSGPMPVDRVCSLAIQAARGLLAAHEAGILHRDLKPENLMVERHADGSDWVKLLDFGVARLMQDSPTITRDGHTPGTVHYMAPEVARGEAASVRSDIYALGVVLFELLTGTKPHPGGNQRAVLHRIASCSAPPIETVYPDLPAWLCELVNSCLSRDPHKRPASARHVIDVLGEHAAGESTERDTDTQILAPAKGDLDGSTSTRGALTSVLSRDKQASPLRVRLLLLAGGFCCLAAAVVVLSIAPRDSEAPPPQVANDRQPALPNSAIDDALAPTRTAATEVVESEVVAQHGSPQTENEKPSSATRRVRIESTARRTARPPVAERAVPQDAPLVPNVARAAASTAQPPPSVAESPRVDVPSPQASSPALPGASAPATPASPPTSPFDRENPFR